MVGAQHGAANRQGVGRAEVAAWAARLEALPGRIAHHCTRKYTTDLRRLDRPGEGRVGVSLRPVKSNTYG